MRRLDANRGATTRVARNAFKRARARRNARRYVWRPGTLVLVGLLIWLLWPVKSLLYYIPKWYIELALGL